MPKITTHSEKQTFNLGKKIAKQLKGGETIALIGELGAGKTVLIKGLAAGLGIKKTITSPTFVLMKLHTTDKHGQARTSTDKIKWLCHVDAYRLKSGQDLIDIGLKDWLGQSDTVTVIEWADRIKEVLPKNKIMIELKMEKEKDERILTTNMSVSVRRKSV
jgi:tRNA threonylcarbamoyladenosine biosynthesis protein TsaE